MVRCLLRDPLLRYFRVLGQSTRNVSVHSLLCREVIATEVAKASVAAAHYNIEANSLDNVHVARLSAEEFVQAWQGEREFFRMQGLPSVKARVFKTLLVCFDPLVHQKSSLSTFTMCFIKWSPLASLCGQKSDLLSSLGKC